MGQCSVIYPKSRWMETWDPFILSFILYSAVVVPFRICFDAEAVGFMWDLEVFISLFFTMDVCFNFNTAYPLDDKWVISRRRIVTKYLSGWFWIDAPSSLPLELIDLGPRRRAHEALHERAVRLVDEPLRLGRDRAEHERALPRARHPGEDRQATFRDIDVHPREVVLPRAAHADPLVGVGGG